MAELGRFIQFNNEQLNARQMLQYETLAKAFASNTAIHVTERQLIEMNVEKEELAMSVFWRHRDKQTMHFGRLSDLYVMSLGFWRHFQLADYTTYVAELKEENLPKMRKQLFFLIEEFRLIEQIQRERPGTKKAFDVRKQTYVETFKHQMTVYQQKGYTADAFLNFCYIAAYEGSLHRHEYDFENFMWQFQQIYDVRSTAQSIDLTWRLMAIVEQHMTKDLSFNLYALLDTLPQQTIESTNHKEACLTEGDSENKETIEELFRTWHRESEKQEGTHLRFELDCGNNNQSVGTDGEEGDPEQDATSSAVGGETNAEATQKKQQSTPTTKKKQQKKKAMKSFGKSNENVTYEEKIMDVHESEHAIRQTMRWRYEQAPYVKDFVKEFQQQMAQKNIAKRDHLNFGRLDGRALLQLIVESRPKPFYKKDAPAKPLDAVFGLLVDGSASMEDKLEETKRAVLLFHDVLRSLQIRHDIVSYYEDAYEATKEQQPNTFEWMHRMENPVVDCAASIMSMEAHEDNRDGFAIRWMTNRLQKREEKHRFLLVFSDGEPSAFEYANNGIVDTTEAVLEAEKKGITVVHLFLNTDRPSEEQLLLFRSIYGNQTVAAASVEQFSDVTLRLLKRLIRQVIQAT